MSSRLEACYTCTKLKPMVRDVAVAVAELDENVQLLCNKSVTRVSIRSPIEKIYRSTAVFGSYLLINEFLQTLDFPSDSPVRTVQWILERLRYAKSDVTDVGHRTQLGYYNPQYASSSGVPSRTISPPSHLKRASDRWDRDEYPKRPRSGASLDQPYQLPSAYTQRDERGAPSEYGSRDQTHRPIYSPPPPAENAAGSGYPRQGSPNMPNRGIRSLPSPSSMAYQNSAAASLPPPTVHSENSPTMSYPPSGSIHTTTTNSATSAHIADLQHQVTLKSLALQTLQTEYASLLQKLQRERVKSQTIEKKTSVADQEVNELTTRNEELTEQLRMLETQLEESEKKREMERAETAREKDQWGRMLEMSSRLQARNAKDRQQLVDEKTRLAQQVEQIRGGDGSDIHRGNSTGVFGTDRTSYGFGQESSSYDDSTGMAIADASDDTVRLKNEVLLLNARIDVLRSCLEEVRRSNKELEGQASSVLANSSKIGDALERAFPDEKPNRRTAAPDAEDEIDPNRSLTPGGQTSMWSPQTSFALSQGQSQGPPSYDGQMDYDTFETRVTEFATSQPKRGASGSNTHPSAFETMPSDSHSLDDLINAHGPSPQPSRSLPMENHDDVQGHHHSSGIPRPGSSDPSARSSYPDQSYLGDRLPRSSITPPDPLSTTRSFTHSIDAYGGRKSISPPYSSHSSPGELVEDGTSSSASSVPRPMSPDAFVGDGFSRGNKSNTKQMRDLDSTAQPTPPRHFPSGYRRSHSMSPSRDTSAMPPPPPPRRHVSFNLHKTASFRPVEVESSATRLQF